MHRLSLSCLGLAIVLMVAANTQARISHGYSEVFTLDTVTAAYDPHGQPSALTLTTIFPNPFNPSVTIEFELDQGSQVDLSIFDQRGRLVRVMESGSWPSGHYRSTWDGLNDEGQEAPTGMYLCRLVSSHGICVKKLTLTR